MVELSNITDLHNRRDNIKLVSTRAKAMGIPFLVWPEDKLLLRIEDLPVIGRYPNQAPDWKEMKFQHVLIIHSDQQLRDEVKIGFAYSITSTCLQACPPAYFVEEFKVTSK